MFLDELTPREYNLGFGCLGLAGDLGFGDQPILCNKQYYPHSIGAHAPSNITYDLDGSYNSFECYVSINDSSPNLLAKADFAVYADEKLVTYIPQVSNSLTPVKIKVNIHGAKTLKLSVLANDPTDCYSTWLNPKLYKDRNIAITGALGDLLINLPDTIVNADKCIALVSTDNFIPEIELTLCSFCENGKCNGATIVVFAFGDISKYKLLQKKFNIIIVPCQLTTDKWSYKLKTAALSIAQIVNANKYLYLDADILILDDIKPLFDLVDLVPKDKVLVSREASVSSNMNLYDALSNNNSIYCCDPDGISLLNLTEKEKQYPLVVNNGVYIGGKQSILSLEHAVRSAAPNSIYWENRKITEKYYWREQGVFNLALAKYDIGIPMDYMFNLQLHCQQVEIDYHYTPPLAMFEGKAVKILHFNGSGRNYCSELKQIYKNKISLKQTYIDTLAIFVDKCLYWYQNNPRIAGTVSIIDNIIKKNKPKSIIVIDDETCFVSCCAAQATQNKIRTITNKGNNEAIKFLGLSNINITLEKDPISYLKIVLESETLLPRYDFAIINKTMGRYDLYALILLLKKLIMDENSKILIIHNNYPDFAKISGKINALGFKITDVYINQNINAFPDFSIIEYGTKGR